MICLQPMGTDHVLTVVATAVGKHDNFQNNEIIFPNVWWRENLWSYSRAFRFGKLTWFPEGTIPWNVDSMRVGSLYSFLLPSPCEANTWVYENLYKWYNSFLKIINVFISWDKTLLTPFNERKGGFLESEVFKCALGVNGSWHWAHYKAKYLMFGESVISFYFENLELGMIPPFWKKEMVL